MSPVVLGYTYEAVDIPIFLTLLLLEGVLSFDNAAILAAMVRKLPVELRRKALLYGLGGAYVFRTLAVLGAAYIIEFPILKAIGGLYLLFLAVKHFSSLNKEHEHHVPGFATAGFLGFSAFWSVVIAVELADIAFALDQVLVAVALTDKLLLIVLASFIAILFLRVSAYYVGRLMDWFPQLESLAYLAVGWVGLKLVGSEIAHRVGYCGPSYFCHEGAFEVPKEISIGVTLTVIVVPVIVKATMDYIKKRRSPREPSKNESDLDRV